LPSFRRDLGFFNLHGLFSKKRTLKLPALKSGATVGVIAIGSAVDPEKFAAGVKYLENLGYKVKCPIDPTLTFGQRTEYFGCAPAVERAEALQELVSDPDVGAVIAARGGYGTTEVLSYLDFDVFRDNPKAVVGFSDVTVLLTSILANCDLPTIHGPALGVEFAKAAESAEAAESVSELFKILSEPAYLPEYRCDVLREADGEGKLLVGNLTMLCSLLGTAVDFDYSGAVLAIEDINEAPYRLHRLLLQLKNAGKLEMLSGLVLGRFSGPEPAMGPTNDDLQQIILNDLLGDSQYPILKNLEFGHCGKNLPLPLGAAVRISGNSLKVLESVVE